MSLPSQSGRRLSTVAPDIVSRSGVCQGHACIGVEVGSTLLLLHDLSQQIGLGGLRDPLTLRLAYTWSHFVFVDDAQFGKAFVPATLIHSDRWHITACPHRGGTVRMDETGRIYVSWYTEGAKLSTQSVEGEPGVVCAMARILPLQISSKASQIASTLPWGLRYQKQKRQEPDHSAR